MKLKVGELYNISIDKSSPFSNLHLDCVEITNKDKKKARRVTNKNGLPAYLVISQAEPNKVGLCLGVDYYYSEYIREGGEDFFSTSSDHVLFLIDNKIMGSSFRILKAFAKIRKIS